MVVTDEDGRGRLWTSTPPPRVGSSSTRWPTTRTTRRTAIRSSRSTGLSSVGLRLTKLWTPAGPADEDPIVIFAQGNVAGDRWVNPVLPAVREGLDGEGLVTIGPPNGTQATATATVSAGAVTGLIVGSGGSGYTAPPAVTIAAPATGSGAAATATVGGAGDRQPVIRHQRDRWWHRLHRGSHGRHRCAADSWRDAGDRDREHRRWQRGERHHHEHRLRLHRSADGELHLRRYGRDWARGTD